MLKTIAIFNFLLSITCLTLGCASGAAQQLATPVPVQYPQPPAVTPIDPPSGIRAQLHTDPRVIYERSEPLEPLSHPYQDGLTLCHRNPNPQEPIEAYAIASGQFEAGLYVHVCGWDREGTPVNVNVTLPDGTTIEEVVETQEHDRYDHRASLILERQSPELVGRYIVVFMGDERTYSAEFEITLPTEPRIYTFRNGDTYLYNFAPNETVQLLRYDISKVGSVSWESGSGISETLTLVAEQTITVEQDGSHSLASFARDVGTPNGREFPSQVVALGDQSGEIASPLSFPLIMRVEESVRLQE